MLRRIFASHDVKQPFSSLSSNATLLLGLQTAALNPAAPCGGRVASYCSHRPRTRGGWSADRRTFSFGRACAARPPGPGATGTPLGAPPWRFSDADPRSRLPAVGHRSRSDCPRQAITAWRSGSGPPYVAVRAASAGRHSLLRLAGSFLENAPSEPGCKSYIINSLRSQEISSYRRRYF